MSSKIPWTPTELAQFPGYLRNVRLVRDKLIDPELDLWVRTVRDDRADVLEIIKPYLEAS